ncbi:MAG: hypothetical protein K2M42_03095 [Oscillospiraceae bacterium]|nr:hypothetical protein [Oscillospiraceae bacterium]
MKEVSKWVLGIVVLLIVTIVIVRFVFIQRQGPVNKLFGRLSSSTVSSLSVQSVARPLKEIVLEEDDQNKLIKLLRKEHYEGHDDPDFASMTGGPKANCKNNTGENQTALTFTSQGRNLDGHMMHGRQTIGPFGL